MEAHIRPIRLVIADRRPIVLQGFASLLAVERDFAIVASCLDGAGCLKAIRNLTPDVVLVEDGFSDVTASEMLAVVNAENLPARLVFYTASVASGDLAAAIAAGSCAAISMREKPETLLHSLRLVAPNSDKAAGKKKGAAMLTDQERKIMRLVAYGMSNKEIARQLEVPTGSVKAHLDQIATQLEVKNRTELAAFALSRLFGAIGSLAALIFAALEDAQAANTTGVGHTSTDTFTVMGADGTGVLTIKINSQKTAAAAGKTAKAVIKAGRVENAAAETPARTGKLIEPGADIAANTIVLPAPNSPRPSLASTFMMATVAVWVYELLNSGAQAFSLGDSLDSVLASATANGAQIALNTPGSADTKLDGFDVLAWQNPKTYSQSFAFEASRSDLMDRRGDELQIVDAAAVEQSVSGNRHVGSGAVDSPILHGGAEQAAAAGASGNAEHGTTQGAGGDESTAHGQSQSELHASEGSGAVGKQHDEHDPPGKDANHGQLQHDVHAAEGGTAPVEQHTKHGPSGGDSTHEQPQKDLHASEGGAAAKQHAKHDPPVNDSKHGQSQADPQASENGSSGSLQHTKHHATPGSDAKPDHSQHDVNTAPPNASNSSQSESKPNEGDKGQAVDHAGQTETAATPGDSFHFKNEKAASKASDNFEVHGSHGAVAEHGSHTGQEEQAPNQSSDLIGLSHIDHPKGSEHHLTHDLIV